MKTLLLTPQLLQWICEECKKFQESVSMLHDVDLQDVLYSYLNSSDESFCIWNDWDEGENNDPYWNKELNEHSAIVFLKDICKRIDFVLSLA